MRIEFVTSYFYPFTGGIENVVLHLAEGLSNNGHTVVVHTGNTYPNAKQLLQSKETHKKFLIKRYPIYPFSLFFPKLEFTDSVVSLHNYSALMNDYVSLRYPKHKKMMTPYGTITYNRSQRKYPVLSIAYDLLLGKQTLFLQDKIIAMTDFERNTIIKKYPGLQSKLLTIGGGIDSITSNKFTKKLPEKYFLSVGRIAQSKRFEDVLSVLQDFPSYHFVLAGGDNGYLTTLEQVAKEKHVADRFFYVGRVTEAEKAFLMENAAVFIMPSLAEAFSIASVEAFYYGKRVVGANSGGIIDIFSELGGETYYAGNIVDLSRALHSIITKQLSSSDIEKRKKSIEKKYTWDTIVQQYEKAFSG